LAPQGETGLAKFYTLEKFEAIVYMARHYEAVLSRIQWPMHLPDKAVVNLRLFAKQRRSIKPLP
jgi:hypothetical protein